MLRKKKKKFLKKNQQRLICERNYWLSQASRPAHKKRRTLRGKAPSLLLYFLWLHTFSTALSYLQEWVKKIITAVCLSLERYFSWRSTYEPADRQLLSLQREQCYFLAWQWRQNTTKQSIFVTACSLLSVCCAGAFLSKLNHVSPFFNSNITERHHFLTKFKRFSALHWS